MKTKEIIKRAREFAALFLGPEKLKELAAG